MGAGAPTPEPVANYVGLGWRAVPYDRIVERIRAMYVRVRLRTPRSTPTGIMLDTKNRKSWDNGGRASKPSPSRRLPPRQHRSRSLPSSHDAARGAGNRL